MEPSKCPSLNTATMFLCPPGLHNFFTARASFFMASTISLRWDSPPKSRIIFLAKRCKHKVSEIVNDHNNAPSKSVPDLLAYCASNWLLGNLEKGANLMHFTICTCIYESYVRDVLIISGRSGKAVMRHRTCYNQIFDLSEQDIVPWELKMAFEDCLGYDYSPKSRTSLLWNQRNAVGIG